MKKIGILLFVLTCSTFAGTIQWESDLNFSHKFHLEDAEAACSDCHINAENSVTGVDDLLPVEETCFECHDKGDMECTDCHAKGETPILLPRIKQYSQKFSHKLHSENEVVCSECHKQVENKDEVISGLHLPVMSDCMQCHETPDEIDGCYSCHTQDEELKPIDHVASWDAEHGIYSESEPNNCSDCHTKSYCIDCHQGENSLSQTHKPDFIITHAMSFKLRETECRTCHENINYCIECHTQFSYVVPINHSLESWKGILHAEEARMDYESCAVCHVSGDETCAECHTN